ncbi:MAG: acyl-CoA dehydrogenase [Azospirillum sp.]|nr:acyl-CoA dehydrogenase [Azospirillum sp.]
MVQRLPDPTQLGREALAAATRLVAQAQAAVAAVVAPQGTIDPDRLDGAQFAAHGLAWLATYVAALEALLSWAERLTAGTGLGELEALIVQVGFGEYLNQIAGGIAMSQGETARPPDLGLDTAAVAAFARVPAVERLRRDGATAAVRQRLAVLLGERLETGRLSDTAPGDDTLVMVQDQFRAVADDLSGLVQAWHRADTLIPIEVVGQLGALGIFGLTIPEAFGGSGLGKLAMCIVTEELARGWLALGSLGTRAEIAGDLILAHGTEEQRARWLPGIADGTLLPCAVFTEPDSGSDLASLRCRAPRDGAGYRVSGTKTWITHGARSDLMILLARSDPKAEGYRGLSMFAFEKPRGTDAEPFPLAGMSGSEIKVIGYRGMKEYEICFDDLVLPASALLGGIEGQGFRQLMSTFESARIQTAARAVGVAQNALELGLRYALDRKQFGRPLLAFPRVGVKLAWMAVETMIARQLTWHAARLKESGRRCDIEAGMAKLLSARVAWANADNAVQIHGGNGYAEEFPISRVLCDARILSIFEGAAEIQAQVIARGLLGRRN